MFFKFCNKSVFLDLLFFRLSSTKNHDSSSWADPVRSYRGTFWKKKISKVMFTIVLFVFINFCWVDNYEAMLGQAKRKFYCRPNWFLVFCLSRHFRKSPINRVKHESKLSLFGFISFHWLIIRSYHTQEWHYLCACLTKILIYTGGIWLFNCRYLKEKKKVYYWQPLCFYHYWYVHLLGKRNWMPNIWNFQNDI